jgi:hypothetical protein
MQRKLIEADGTVYAAKQAYGADRAVRVVETDRLWTKDYRGYEGAFIVPAKPAHKMSSSPRNSSTYYSRYWRYTGFLVVSATDNDEETLEALRTLDTHDVETAPYDEAEAILKTWMENLPEGLTADVAVARQFLDPWDVYLGKSAAEVAARDAKRKQRNADYARENEIRAQVASVMEAQGIRDNSYRRPGRVNITIDAEDFMALIERLTNKDDA